MGKFLQSFSSRALIDRFIIICINILFRASSASLNSIPIDPIDVDRLRDELSEMFRLELDRAKRELVESFRDELAQIISATIPSKMQLPDSQ